ncbi:FkbM family methyltransferase [Marinobacter sp. NFXS9]|uniref:FkbM family methyltransferase n=1 Tax=Marinobacter sp. NFXS9 TaxID=2818433 RepID=UPI0032DEF456
MLRQLAKKLPWSLQHQLKQFYYRSQISKGTFKSPEMEFNIINRLISPKDWVMDIGANVGHYTRRFSDLTPQGRVIAIEPHPITFSYLASNVADLKNVTLINAALSDHNGLVGFTVPNNNFYQASIDASSDSKVICISPAVLNFESSINFIKIDAEGHEPFIIKALENLITKDRPILMIEHNTELLKNWCSEHEYEFHDLTNSHNHILVPISKSEYS